MHLPAAFYYLSARELPALLREEVIRWVPLGAVFFFFQNSRWKRHAQFLVQGRVRFGIWGPGDVSVGFLPTCPEATAGSRHNEVSHNGHLDDPPASCCPIRATCYCAGNSSSFLASVECIRKYDGGDQCWLAISYTHTRALILSRESVSLCKSTELWFCGRNLERIESSVQMTRTLVSWQLWEGMLDHDHKVLIKAN